MVRIKKPIPTKHKTPTKQSTPLSPPKKAYKDMCCSENINWLSIWNAEHATLLKQNYPPKCLICNPEYLNLYSCII